MDYALLQLLLEVSHTVLGILSSFIFVRLFLTRNSEEIRITLLAGVQIEDPELQQLVEDLKAEERLNFITLLEAETRRGKEASILLLLSFLSYGASQLVEHLLV